MEARYLVMICDPENKIGTGHRLIARAVFLLRGNIKNLESPMRLPDVAIISHYENDNLELTSMGMLDSDARPWGRWEEYLNEPGYRIKRIIVDPGGVLSAQYHEKRKEYWVVVQGAGFATKGSQRFAIGTGDTVQIDIGEHHRLEAVNDESLVLIEVQMGICEEDDIVRTHCIYGRASPGGPA